MPELEDPKDKPVKVESDDDEDPADDPGHEDGGDNDPADGQPDGIQFYTQHERDFLNIVDELSIRGVNNGPRVPVVVYRARLDQIVGRNNTHCQNRYNTWKTVMPFLGSLVNYLLTGSSLAPGNPWVRKYVHNPAGQNPNHFGLTAAQFPEQRRLFCIETLRTLFPWTEIQVANPMYQVFVKHMCIVYRAGAVRNTYLIRLRWDHRNNQDNISVTIAQYDIVPVVIKHNVAGLAQAFMQLGVN
jgi:hypothetical protein